MLEFKLTKLLNERTHHLDDDVDFIYEKARYGELVKAIENKDLVMLDQLRLMYKYDYITLHSSQLTNEDSIAANEINPVEIYIGRYEGYGNYYKPALGFIQLEPNMGVLDLYYTQGFDAVYDYINNNQLDRFKNEITENSLKGSIYHELTHWIDDSLYGRFLNKKTQKAFELKSKIPMLGKKSNVNHTYYEVNSQIHAIKQIKRKLGQEKFNQLGWEDLFKLKSSLMTNFSGFKSEDDYNVFVNDFYRRLFREGLLTDKLTKEKPNWATMRQILNRV